MKFEQIKNEFYKINNFINLKYKRICYFYKIITQLRIIKLI